jgi:hypothetical protein
MSYCLWACHYCLKEWKRLVQTFFSTFVSLLTGIFLVLYSELFFWACSPENKLSSYNTFFRRITSICQSSVFYIIILICGALWTLILHFTICIVSVLICFKITFLPSSTVCAAASVKCRIVYKVTFSLKSTLNFDEIAFKSVKLSNLSSRQRN